MKKVYKSRVPSIMSSTPKTNVIKKGFWKSRNPKCVKVYENMKND